MVFLLSRENGRQDLRPGGRRDDDDLCWLPFPFYSMGFLEHAESQRGLEPSQGAIYSIAFYFLLRLNASLPLTNPVLVGALVVV